MKRYSIVQNSFLQELKDSTLEDDKKYDILIYYLRSVHFYCYYTQQEYSSYQAIVVKNQFCYIRPKQIIQQDIGIPNWQDQLVQKNQAKLGQLQQNEISDINETINNAINNQIQKKQKKNDSSWACPHCDKKFKASFYLIKHLENKHEEEFLTMKDKIIEKLTKENYKLDINKAEEIQENAAKLRENKPYEKKHFVDYDQPKKIQGKKSMTIDFDEI